MNITRCPHCSVKLGNFLYADACPSCRGELGQNTKPLIADTPRELHKQAAWPIRLLLSVVRFAES